MGASEYFSETCFRPTADITVTVEASSIEALDR